MEVEIGNAAGIIWKYLDQHGETTLAKLKQRTRLSDRLLLMGSGWLAREGNLHFVQDKRSLRVSLKGR